MTDAGADDISDSTEWINTPVASLAPVEASLRCQICKDFYQAPVLTACSHTFCSACIRRSLSAVNASRKCPLCRAPFDERQLRKNSIIEDLVRTFQAARAEILSLGQEVAALRMEGTRVTRKRKLDATEETSAVLLPRKTRSQSKKPMIFLSSTPPEQEESSQGQCEEIEGSPKDDGLVPCPICQRRMPEAQVFLHLDTHSETKQLGLASTKSTIHGSSQLPPRPQSYTPSMNSLPTLSYSIFNEQQLRRKMRELGIPAEGSKQAMIRRHTEWRNLVNANNDSSIPKLKNDLLRELNQWEKVQNIGSSGGMTAGKSGLIMEKDFDRDDWSKNHGNDFRDLVALARMKSKPQSVNKVQSLEESKYSSREDNSRVAVQSSDAQGSSSTQEMASGSQLAVIDLTDNAQSESVPIPSKIEQTGIIK